MKINEPEQKPMTDAELDAALAQLAEEAPPMPADFHDRWMNAVRAEAKETKNESAEQTASKHIVSINRWTRILSVAAVFVFLIGGTLLYRNTKKSLDNSPLAADKRKNAVLSLNAAEAPATEPPAESAAEAAEQIPEEEVSAVNNLTAESSAAEDMAYMEEADCAAEAEAVYEAEEAYEAEEEAVYAAEAGGAYESYAMKAAGSASNAYAAGEAAEAAAFDAAAPAPMSAPAALPTEAPTPEPTATLAPTPEPTETPEPAPAPTEEPEAEPAGFLPELGAFFTDMGDFLLAALPYLLVLAVPALAALVIRRKKNRKG